MKKGWMHLSYGAKRGIIVTIAIVLFAVFYMLKNTSFLNRSISTLSFLIVFYLIDHLFDVKFKTHHYVFIVIIAIASFLLSPLYYMYPLYDKILHFVQPILFCSIFFHAVDHLKIKLKWKLAFTFFIVTSCVGMFEIGEYVLDQFFDLKLQGVFLRNLQTLEKYDVLVDRIDDTMIDMGLGVIGAIFYCLARIPYYKYIRRKPVTA